MDYCLVGLLVTAALVVSVIAMVTAHGLRQRLEALETRLETLARSRPPAATTPPAPVAPPVVPAEALQEISEPVVLEPVTLQPAPPTASKPPPSPPPPPPPRQPVAPSAPAEPRRKPVTLEERVGVRLFVWIAAVAIAIAGGYFVKWSYDNNLLAPPVRISIACLFGVALLGAGEWMLSRSRRIASAMVAAGVAVLFAALLAGIHVEHLIPKAVGFILLAIVAAAAVGLSLRYGQIVALLGLVGGFATPALIGPRQQEVSTLFGYLFLIQAALVATTRRRGWWWLTVLTLLSGYGWAGLWFLFFFTPDHATALALFLIGTAGVFVLGTAGQIHGPLPTVIRFAGAAIGLVLVAVLLRVTDFTTAEWVYLGILGAGCMAVARFDRKRASQPLSWLALTSGVVLLAAWMMSGLNREQEVRFAWTALGYGLLYALGGYALMWGSARPGQWASLSVVAAVAYLRVADRGTDFLPFAHFWGVLCLALAAAYTLMAIPVGTRRATMTGGEPALAALCVGVAAMLALAVPLELERQWITVAWALLAAAVIGIYTKLSVRTLRIVAAVLVYLVVLRLLLNPMVLTYPVGATPVFNWLLYGYGVPALAIGAAAWLLRRKDGPDGMVCAFEFIAIALVLALVTLEVRHFFHRETGVLNRGLVTFTEMGTYLSAWLAAVAAMLLSSQWPRHAAVKLALPIVLLGALAVAALTLLLVYNPMFTPQPVGQTLVVNALLYVYGLPAALCAMVAWLGARRGSNWQAVVAGVGALVLFLALVTLEVRHGFHPAAMRVGPASSSPTLVESATYPIAWLLVGCALLGAALRWPRATFRWGGAVIVFLAAAAAVLVLVFDQNPMSHAHDVGAVKVFNWLLYAYGLPATVLLLSAELLRRLGQTIPARMMFAVSLLMMFTLLSLEVRQAFHGPVLRGGELSHAENYAYSVAWIAFGALLLVLGIVMRSGALRWASLAVTMLSVGKVFLWDMAHLRDLWRVLAFLGLGLTLLLLAFLYQRFVFRRAPEE